MKPSCIALLQAKDFRSNTPSLFQPVPPRQARTTFRGGIVVYAHHVVCAFGHCYDDPPARRRHLDDRARTCAGSTAGTAIDGQQVASVQDDTYAAGQTFIEAGVTPDFLPGVVDVRFSNLVLSQP